MIVLLENLVLKVAQFRHQIVKTVKEENILPMVQIIASHVLLDHSLLIQNRQVVFHAKQGHINPTKAQLAAQNVLVENIHLLHRRHRQSALIVLRETMRSLVLLPQLIVYI